VHPTSAYRSQMGHIFTFDLPTVQVHGAISVMYIRIVCPDSRELDEQ